MSYAFLIVVSVAITVKLLFLTFSMYFTLKQRRRSATLSDQQTTRRNRSMAINWKHIPRMLLPKSLYCSDVNNSSNYTNKL